ncbi:uncharacterized protein LOC112571265 [Pomacea canaliculata]|uniref:uncharacterized protein LOC112571265 n=1 Tax=Pomacea canaliculata TaxID=400727 RepID=UPI000D72665F|nr:uncharacterized protein LOC112571265 [Pomacea canaliculata]
MSKRRRDECYKYRERVISECFQTTVNMTFLVFLLACVTSAVIGQLKDNECLALPCAPPTCDPQKWVLNYYFHNGRMCPGCESCIAEDQLEKRQLVEHNICPVVDCFFPPRDCPVDLVMGTIQIGNLKCPGCPICPSTTLV